MPQLNENNNTHRAKIMSALVGSGGKNNDNNAAAAAAITNHAFLPPRILLLALYLMFTLSSFWILDSIKEPTLALLVPDHDLGKHQPRAKMVSFVVVVLLAFIMELVVRAGRRQRNHKQILQRPGGHTPRGQQQQQQQQLLIDKRNAALEKSWQDRHLPAYMQNKGEEEDNDNNLNTRWCKMGIKWRLHELRQWQWRTTMSDKNGDDDQEEEEEETSSSSKISIIAFYIVGAMYMKAFIIVALILRHYHPMNQLSLSLSSNNDSSSSSSSSSSNSTAGYILSSSPSSSPLPSSWYHTALGYIFFALIESYGSVSITLFWSFANSHLTLEAAEKYYGSTVALAQAGAIGGSTLVAVLGRRTITKTAPMIVDVTTDDIVGFATSHKQVSVERNDATPTLIFMACGSIFAGMAIMVMYARLFATPMMSQQQRYSSSNYDRILDHPNEVQDEQLDDISTFNKGIDREGDDIESPLVVDDQPKSKDDYLDNDVHNVNDRSRTSNNTSLYRHGNSNSSINDSSSIFADLLGGVYMIYRHEYLQLVLAASVLYEIALTCMHYEMNLLGLDRFGVGVVDNGSILGEQLSSNTTTNDDKDSGITYIQFLGWYGQTVNILSLFLSFYAFPRLIQNYGLSTTIRIFPTILLLVTIFAFILFPKNLYFLFISLSICKALTYSIHDPAEEVLYMPTSDDAKFRAKFWIDVVGQRIAKATGSAINNYAGSVEEIVKYGSLPSIVSALALWLVCYQVGNQFDSLIKSGEVVGLKIDDGDDDDKVEGRIGQEDDMELSEIEHREINTEGRDVTNRC